MYRVLFCSGIAATILAFTGVGTEVLAQEPRSGTITGELKSKKDTEDKKNTTIEVLAPGEEKARSYFVQYDQKVKGPLPDVLKAVRAATVGDKVEFGWVATGHGPAITKFQVLKKTDGEKKDEARKGTVTGILTARGETWIEVRADGEEKARRYVPHWRGGAPAQGGGADKEMVAKLKGIPVNSRVTLDWVFEERPRVEKIEILGKPGEKK
jgi:hypothetical protein